MREKWTEGRVLRTESFICVKNRELEQGEEFLALNFLYVSKLYSYHRELA